MVLPQVQYSAYANIGGLGSVIKLMFAGILFLLLVKFSFGRKLLSKELSVWIFFCPLVYCCLVGFFPCSYIVPGIFLCGILHKERTNPETGS